MAYSKAIVTGGAGFIGSHLVDALVARGCEVVVIDKETPSDEKRNAQAKYEQCDISDAVVKQIFIDEQPEVVFHLAAHIDDRESVREPVMNAENNIIGSLNIFEAARQVGVKKIVFASTGVVYGRAEVLPTSESELPKPLTPYAVSKLTGERYLYCYKALYGVDYVALRLSNVYGPRQDGSKECGAIAIFTRKLLAGEAVNMNNDGLTTRDYIYVDDVVAAMIAAADADKVGIYNIGTGVETSTSDLLRMVVGELGTVPKIALRPDIMDEVKKVALNAEKAKKDFGWEPGVTLGAGLASTIAWYKARL
jgi:UDP-glucose 4-epimerase